MISRETIPAFVLALACAAMAGCSASETDDSSSNPLVIRDTARVVSVDPQLGLAVLDLHGKQVRAFWQTEIMLAQGGVVNQPDATGTRLPVGQYKEPVARTQTFAASPGQTIEFLGMWAGDQIFLRSIAIQGK